MHGHLSKSRLPARSPSPSFIPRSHSSFRIPSHHPTHSNQLRAHLHSAVAYLHHSFAGYPGAVAITCVQISRNERFREPSFNTTHHQHALTPPARRSSRHLAASRRIDFTRPQSHTIITTA
jgi:hypothetical protein